MAIRYATLTPDDRPSVVEHLLGLDGDDRALRFNTTAPDHAVVGYCGRWDYARDIVEGAWDGPSLVGVIHVPVFDARGVLVGEIGVSVATAWRRHHIGTGLVMRALDAGRARGLDRIYINFLTRNRPMTCLAHRFTREVEVDGDETVAIIRLAAAMPASAGADG
jgi:GNAT superfamily N-acetyltransferase